MYEPRLMAAVLGAAQDAKTNAKKRKTDKDHKGIEQNPRAAPAFRKRRRGAPLDPHDPLGDEGDDDVAAADDDELSGDSARGDSSLELTHRAARLLALALVAAAVPQAQVLSAKHARGRVDIEIHVWSCLVCL